MKIIENFYKGIILVFFVPILLLIEGLTVSGSCYLDLKEEITYFVKDNSIVNIAVVLAVLLLMYLLYTRGKTKQWLDRLDEDDEKCRKLRVTILGVLWAMCMVWILSTQCTAIGDQQKTLLGALGLYEGDYTLFQEGGYLQMYPNQLGLVLLEYALTRFFGGNNYLLIQVINTFMIVSFYWSLTEICRLLEWRNRVQLGVLVSAIWFFPLVMYCSFAYGNWIGLALSAAAIRYELRSFRTHKWYDAFFAALAVCLAVLVKQNYLIMFIGVLLAAVFECIRSRKPAVVLLLVFLLGGYAAQAKLPVLAVREITGETLDQGCSSWSWIAMGLQEGPRAEGWYNRYNRESYAENDGDPEAQGQQAKAYIADRCREFVQYPGKALRFFSKKTASQWTDPNFGSFWVVYTRDLGVQPSGPVKWILSVKGEYTLSWFLEIFNLVIFLGCIGYCFFSWDGERFTESLVIPMIFVGGFVFHLFWEAKVQYTLSYYVFLFPFACAGLTDCFDQVSAAIRSREIGSSCRSFMIRRKWLLIYTALAVLALVFVYSGGRMSWIGEDTEVFLTEIMESVRL